MSPSVAKVTDLQDALLRVNIVCDMAGGRIEERSHCVSLSLRLYCTGDTDNFWSRSRREAGFQEFSPYRREGCPRKVNVKQQRLGSKDNVIWRLSSSCTGEHEDRTVARNVGMVRVWDASRASE